MTRMREPSGPKQTSAGLLTDLYGEGEGGQTCQGGDWLQNSRLSAHLLQTLPNKAEHTCLVIHFLSQTQI